MADNLTAMGRITLALGVAFALAACSNQPANDEVVETQPVETVDPAFTDGELPVEEVADPLGAEFTDDALAPMADPMATEADPAG